MWPKATTIDHVLPFHYSAPVTHTQHWKKHECQRTDHAMYRKVINVLPIWRENALTPHKVLFSHMHFFYLMQTLHG